jgi:hypothetical protein
MRRRFHFADAAVGEFWRRVIAASRVPARSLGLFRWAYGLFVLAFCTPFSAWIDRVPSAFFDPPPLTAAAAFRTFPPPPFFLAIDCVAVVALCFVTVGFRTRLATATLLAANLIAATFSYSFGKIDHDILMSAVLACMIAADWGRYYSVDSVITRHRPPSRVDPERAAARGVAVFAVLLAFGMLSAGLEKAYRWMDFNLETSGTLSWFLPNHYSFRRGLLLAPFVARAPTIVFELADHAAPVFELSGFVALLWSRRAWLAWLLVACAFHLANAMLLNISFAGYALLYLIFVNLAHIRDRIGGSEAFVRKVLLGAGGACVVAMGAWHLATRLSGGGSFFAFLSDPLRVEAWSLYISLPMCAISGTVIVGELRSLKSAVSAEQPFPQPRGTEGESKDGPATVTALIR